MTLWEIDAQMLNCVDMETGEIIDWEELDRLEMLREEKLENVALWIKNLAAEAAAIKAEAQALAARQKAAEKKVESLKRYLAAALDGQKWSCPRASVSFRRSEAVEVDDVDLLAPQFLSIPKPTADKTAIKEAIKRGEEVTGAHLVQNVSTIIK